MFALEIYSKEDNSLSDVIYIRRSFATIGGVEDAHVYISELAYLEYQLQLSKDLGKKFLVRPVSLKDGSTIDSIQEESYEFFTMIDTNTVELGITSLDMDLLVKENEMADKAGVRILRQACSKPSPVFPAIAVLGKQKMIMSFVPDQPLYIGRARSCQLRIDSPVISAVHARIEYESGKFWIEDLGSTNGTFVNKQQVSGRVQVQAGDTINLAKEINIVGINKAEQIATIIAAGSNKNANKKSEDRYPALVSLSESARPARLVLKPGNSVSIGRDPSSDMWLGSPQVSRHHCEVLLSKAGNLTVTDHSTNGTGYDRGILKEGDQIQISQDGQILNFGDDLTVAICFTAEQERIFQTLRGAPNAFYKNNITKRATSKIDQSVSEKLMSIIPYSGIIFKYYKMFLNIPVVARFFIGIIVLLFILIILSLVLGRV